MWITNLVRALAKKSGYSCFCVDKRSQVEKIAGGKPHGAVLLFKLEHVGQITQYVHQQKHGARGQDIIYYREASRTNSIGTCLRISSKQKWRRRR